MEKVKLLRTLGKIKRAADRSHLTRIPMVRNGVSYIREKWFAEFYDEISQSVTVNLDGIQIVLPRRFLGHYVHREYEPITRRTFTEALQPGMFVVDVGAHIGYYALIAAKLVGRSGTVHAVEPCKNNLEFLEKSVSLNSFGNIEIHPFAAGRGRARRLFHITESSDSNGFYRHPNTETLQTIEVIQAPLDDLVQGRLDAIKIDVEGAEIEVLEGMSRILERNRKLQLWVEWFPAGMRNAGHSALDLPRKLLDLGFDEVVVIDDCAKRIRSVDEVASLLSSGILPRHWYANLWAKRN